MTVPDALPTSKLGTQGHWDSVYEREVDNFTSHGDKGEIWFGHDSVQRMVDFLESQADTGRLTLETTSILDIGTGNGHLLFALLEDVEGDVFVKPENMLGIDYSAPSITLCRQIAQNSDKEDCKRIRFDQVDFLKEASKLKSQRWNVVCDKGTLDAIALSSAASSSTSAASPLQNESAAQTPVEEYASSLSSITQAEDLFVITSCNFTEQELVQLFSKDFDVYHVVPVPSFSFGGQKGSSTVTIAFQRR